MIQEKLSINEDKGLNTSEFKCKRFKTYTCTNRAVDTNDLILTEEVISHKRPFCQSFRDH